MATTITVTRTISTPVPSPSNTCRLTVVMVDSVVSTATLSIPKGSLAAYALGVIGTDVMQRFYGCGINNLSERYASLAKEWSDIIAKPRVDAPGGPEAMLVSQGWTAVP